MCSNPQAAAITQNYAPRAQNLLTVAFVSMIALLLMPIVCLFFLLHRWQARQADGCAHEPSALLGTMQQALNDMAISTTVFDDFVALQARKASRWVCPWSRRP
jgi:hypothetical protein